MNAEQIEKKRRVYLVVASLTLMCVGTIYGFSMFTIGLMNDYGFSRTAVSPTFNIMMISFCICSILGSQLLRRFGIKTTAIISAVLFALGFCGTGLFADGNATALYLCYGVIGGAGAGIGYDAFIAITNVWFPDKVGVSSGVLMMGYGLGPLLIGNISVALYNAGLPLSGMFILIGLLTATVEVVAAFVLKAPPYNIAEIMSSEQTRASSYNPADEDNALKTPLFYLFWIWAAIVGGISLTVVGNCASDAQLIGWEAGFATVLVSIVSTFNAFGRVIFGKIVNSTSVKFSMTINSVISTTGTLCIALGFALGIPVLFVCGALLCGLGNGGAPVAASSLGLQRYGSRKYAFTFSMLNFNIIFASLLSLTVQSAAEGGSRGDVFTTLFVLGCASIVLMIPFSRIFNSDMKRLAERKDAHDAREKAAQNA